MFVYILFIILGDLIDITQITGGCYGNGPGLLPGNDVHVEFNTSLMTTNQLLRVVVLVKKGERSAFAEYFLNVLEVKPLNLTLRYV